MMQDRRWVADDDGEVGLSGFHHGEQLQALEQQLAEVEAKIDHTFDREERDELKRLADALRCRVEQEKRLGSCREAGSDKERLAK